MADSQRIVLAGAGDQEVGTSPTTLPSARIHPSNPARSSTWRCHLRTENPATRVVRTLWERLARHCLYYPI